MSRWNTSVCGAPGAESLERRWLLSAPGDSVVDLDGSDLPPDVVAALSARYPGAQPLEAEFRPASGEYEIDAKLNGRVFETTITLKTSDVPIEKSTDATPTQPADAAPAPVAEPMPAAEPAPVAGPAPTVEPPHVVDSKPVIDAASPSEPATPPAPLQVVYLAPDEQDDTDAEIRVSQLPKDILAEIKSLFPGATLSEAETGSEDGSLFYGVNVARGGGSVELKFSTDGTVVSIEQPVTQQNVPQSVRAWVHDNFPGGAIEEVAAVVKAGTLNYDVQIAPAGGGPVDATFHVSGSAQPGAKATTPAGVRALLPSSTTTNSTVAESISELDAAKRSTQPVALAASPHTAAPQSDRSNSDETAAVTTDESSSGEPDARRPPAAAVSQQDADADASIAARDRPAPEESPTDGRRRRPASAKPSLAASQLPALVVALSEVIPMDLDAAQRHLRGVLEGLNLLAEKAARSPAAGGAAAAAVDVALAAAAAVAALELFVESRRPRRGAPVSVFDASTSTWSWVLGSAADRTTEES